jgi:hypothetical protein
MAGCVAAHLSTNTETVGRQREMQDIIVGCVVFGVVVSAPGCTQPVSRKRVKVAAAPRTRSMVANRTRLIAGVDGRSSTARRYRDLIKEYTDFVREHGGGLDLSPAELGMIRQAAAITLRAEQLQAAVVLDQPVLTDELVRLSSEARRIISSLRIRQHSRKAPLSLREHLAAFNKPSSRA